MMNTSNTIRVLNLLFFGLTIYINFLSVTGQLGGLDIRALSDKYDNLFTPANLTFSIWSLIYLLLTVAMVLQFFNRFGSGIPGEWLFIISCLGNAGWIVIWQNELIGLSLIVMLTLLVSLTAINLKLTAPNQEWYRLTFGVYLGWICVATIANSTAWLVSLGLRQSLGNEVIWPMVLMTAGGLIGYLVMRRLGNPYLAIAIVWAFYGISLKRWDDYPDIAWFARGAALLVAAGAVHVQWIRMRQIASAAG